MKKLGTMLVSLMLVSSACFAMGDYFKSPEMKYWTSDLPSITKECYKVVGRAYPSSGVQAQAQWTVEYDSCYNHKRAKAACDRGLTAECQKYSAL